MATGLTKDLLFLFLTKPSQGFHRVKFITMKVRKPAVAGYFYPSDKRRLEEYVDKLTKEKLEVEGAIKGLIVPHAGYECSGVVAGKVYALLKNGSYKRVVLVGPSHYTDFYGYSFGSFEAFETPLGMVEVDNPALKSFKGKALWDDIPHLHEHSLEVQLPFLQRLLKDFLLVPVVYGRIEAQRIKELLDMLCDENTLFVISSDLSHYYTDATARRIDAYCHRWILEGEEGFKEGCEACGKVGIEGALLYAKEKGLKARLIDYKTSAETCGDDKRVVGYGGYVFIS